MPTSPLTPPTSEHLADWLQWLEKLHPTDIELGLERVSQVADRLAIRQRLQANATQVVTVAGTNGKGSCVATVAAVAQAQGRTVGSYTSPHFLQFNERIRLNGEMVSDQALVAAFRVVEQARQGVSLTYFEYTTLAALELFATAQLALVVLEVGLGGRLDAVNILDADIAIITQVAMDHEAWLGDSREAIGREKAGILRAGQLAICVDPAPPQAVLAQASALGTRLIQAGSQLRWREQTGQLQWLDQCPRGDNFVAGQWHSLAAPQLALPSVVAGLQAALWLGLDVDSTAVTETVANLHLPGRLQPLQWRGRQWLLDVAHNPAAAEYVATRLPHILSRLTRGEHAPGQPTPGQRTVAVMAAMADKDFRGVMQALSRTVDYWYVAGLPDIPRAASVRQLHGALTDLGLAGESCDTVPAALDAAIAGTHSTDCLIVIGSFYTLANVLAQLPEEPLPEELPEEEE